MDTENKGGKVGIGFFPGSWDLLHPGHIRALKEAKEQCEALIVGLQEDPSIDRPEKHKPVMTVEERKEMLEAIKYVDAVLVYGSEDDLHKLDASETMPFTKRFMGEDHKGKLHHFIRANVIYVSRDHGYSSSSIRERINEAKT